MSGEVVHLDGGRFAWWRQINPRRRAWILGLALAAIGITVWAVARIGRTDQRPQASGGRAGMKGMPGMDMDAQGAVQLSAAQIADFGITFGTVDMRTLESNVRTVGTVTFDETRLAQVAPKFGGFVERLYVNFTGQRVQRGQPLLEIYSPELVGAQQELLIARRLERTMDESGVPGVPSGSSNLLAAARRRLALWDISEEQVNDILRTGEVRRTLTLHAPASGVVVDKNVIEGQATMAGERLYTIADLSMVWIDVELREADAASVRVGAGADIEVTGLPGRPYKGRVEYVYPTLQQEARTVRARVAVTNTAGLLKPGMYATVRVTAPIRSALTVPTSAVLRTGERNVVFVDMGSRDQRVRLMPQEIEVGRAAGEWTEVLTGVEPGQRVVTSAQFLLDSESNLAEVMRAMMTQMSMSDVQQMPVMPDMPGMPMPATKSPPGRR